MLHYGKEPMFVIYYYMLNSFIWIALSVSIWNLVEILRHVDRSPKLLRTHYPNSYLKLPLLKFEMLNMRAAAPEIYEENS